MIEYLLLHQLYQKPNIDFQAAVQQALAGPKVAAVSGAELYSSLDSKLSSSNLQPREFNLDQVKEALSKPYLDERAKPSLYYSDWISRGEMIKYALTNFSNEQLMEIRNGVIDHSLWGIVFTTYNLDERLQNLNRTMESILRKPVGDKAVYGKAPAKAKIEMLNQMSDRVHAMQKEIFQLMKDKGIN